MASGSPEATGYGMRHLHARRLGRALVGVVFGILLVTVAQGNSASAESIAPSVHWGAIAYPDRDRTLVTGMTFNRFTEFDGAGRKFNAVEESAGFNFATVSWTERISALSGWNTNLTVGAGPTRPDPTFFLQNKFMHRLLKNNAVPVGQRRRETDFMINGSVTRWMKLFGDHEVGFFGFGFASGSLYHEAFARTGLRRVSLAEVFEPIVGANSALQAFSRYVRVSAMGQYGRLFGGAAFGRSVLADQSLLGQVSVSIAAYGNDDIVPDWELEFAATIDSGLFSTASGGSIERRFGSIAIRFPYGYVESWNDVLGGTDSGPTYGFHVMFDVRRLYALVTAARH